MMRWPPPVRQRAFIDISPMPPLPKPLSPAIFGPMSEQPAFQNHALNIAMSGDRGDNDGASGPGVSVATRTRTRTKRPSHYKVLMLNDDYTPMEFVVHVLQRFFKMDMEEATRVMLHVHQRGVGICGVFSYEVAESKVNQVMDFARQNQHPLQCTLEKA